MSLSTNANDLATRIATELKAHKVLINGNAIDLAALTTTEKSNLVAALNEVRASIPAAGAVINDATTDTPSAWSGSKTDTSIKAAVAAVVGAAGADLDTLKELADALGSDKNFAATVNAALASRVRYDAPQALTAPQKVQATDNIGAATVLQVGDTTADFVATFNSGLV